MPLFSFSGRDLPGAVCSFLLLGISAALGGPFSKAQDDPGNLYDAPIPGFMGPNGEGQARLANTDGTYQNPENYVNPLFFDWVSAVPVYAPAPGVASSWQTIDKVKGPVTGDNFDIISLGDLSASQESTMVNPGAVTLSFNRLISDLAGADFVVFENSFASAGEAGVAGQVFADLGYVEVSSDGVHFARFPSESRTPAAVGAYGTIDPTNVWNLVGKHANAGGTSWGTPFDLADLVDDPAVINGTVKLGQISQIRIVDIPGNGFYKDAKGAGIYDAWQTAGSGGVDLEAVGIVSSQIDYPAWAAQKKLSGGDAAIAADPDHDGLPNLLEYAFFRMPDRADGVPVSRVTLESGRAVIHFQRDLRAADLLYEVQVSTDLKTWETIARSAGGQPFSGAGGYSPTITDLSASANASIGVIREITVADVKDSGTRRFLRVRVTR